MSGNQWELHLLVDLIHVTTEDGCAARWCLRTPAELPRNALGADAVLCLHGTGSNFYASNMMASLTTALVGQRHGDGRQHSRP